MTFQLLDPATNQTVFTFLSEFNKPWTGQTVIEVIFLVLILIFGIAGNTLVLVAISWNKKLRTVTNILICNLSVADILFALGIPFIATTRLSQHWILGDAVCKIVTYVQFISGVCSILTMTTISVDRFTRVCFVGKFKMSSRELWLSLLGIWVISVAFPVPVLLSQTVISTRRTSEEFTFCGVQWIPGFQSNIYMLFMCGVFFLVPLIVTSVLYYKIWRTVHETSVNMTTLNSNLDQRKVKSARKQVRMVKMFVCIVILFVCMWLPFFVLSILGVHYGQITSTQLTATLILALANTCQNPVLYGYFNYRLRDEFKVIFDRICCRRKMSTYGMQGVEFPSVGSRSKNNSSTV